MNIFCGILFGVLIILLLPIRFHLIANNIEGMYISFKVTYGLGLLSYTYKKDGEIYGQATAKVLGIPIDGRHPKEAKEDVPVKKRGPTKRIKGKRFFQGLESFRQLYPFIPKVVGSVLNSILGKQAFVRLKLGFEDPAYTGMVAGIMACITTYSAGFITYAPDFSGRNIEVDMGIKGTVIPIAILFIGINCCIFYVWNQIIVKNYAKGGKGYEFNG